MTRALYNEGPCLEGWYPGLGEVMVLDSLSPITREFLAEAVQENPDFLTDYLVPVFDGSTPGKIIEDDLAEAIAEYECEISGLGELGFLGKKSAFSKVRKAISKVHSKIIPKPLQKIEKKLKKVEQHVVKAVKKDVKKIWVKYGNIILEVVGAVLSPFTGGASLVAAQVLMAANTAYQKKRQAQRAKKEARKEAAQLEAQAQQANAETQRQVDDFYNQNQSWFLQYGITPDKWNSLTLDQKIGLIDAGSKGQLPKGSMTYTDQNQAAQAPPTQTPVSYSEPPASTYPQMPVGRAAPSSGGGGGTGADWGSLTPYGQGAAGPGGGGGGSPTGADRQMAEAGLFGDGGGMLVPAALVAGAVLLSGSGKKGGGGRRRRRNPRRRMR